VFCSLDEENNKAFVVDTSCCNDNDVTQDSSIDTYVETVVANRKQVRRRKHKRRVRPHLNRRHVARSPSSRLEQVDVHTYKYFDYKSSFVNVELDFPENPCFARVWTFRHWLDKDSPLLKSRVKKLLEGRHNMWPLHMKNHATLRKSLVPFTKILCKLSGVCGDL